MKSTAVLRHSSSFKVANTTSIHHFSFLLWLDLVRFHSRKPIFRGTLNLLITPSKQNVLFLNTASVGFFINKFGQQKERGTSNKRSRHAICHRILIN